jgi:hypothetical protein
MAAETGLTDMEMLRRATLLSFSSFSNGTLRTPSDDVDFVNELCGKPPVRGLRDDSDREMSNDGVRDNDDMLPSSTAVRGAGEPGPWNMAARWSLLRLESMSTEEEMDRRGRSSTELLRGDVGEGIDSGIGGMKNSTLPPHALYASTSASE